MVMNYILNSYSDKEDNKERDGQIFRQIVLNSATPDDSLILEEKLEKLKSKVLKLEELLDNDKKLNKDSYDLDHCIKQLEDYFLCIDDFKSLQKNKIVLGKEQLTVKKSKLKDLQNLLEKKRDSFLSEALGFNEVDGKKKSHFLLEHKKFHLEKLENTRFDIHHLQKQYLEADTQYTQNRDMMKPRCREFNLLSSMTIDIAKTVLNPLNLIQDFKIKDLCEPISLNFPSNYQFQFMKESLVKQNVAVKNTLDDLKSKLNSALVQFNYVISIQSQKLKEMAMDQRMLLVNLEVSKCAEAQRQDKLNREAEQSIQKMKALELERDRFWKRLFQCRARNAEKKRELELSRIELSELKTQMKWTNMTYKDYLSNQLKLFHEQENTILAVKLEAEKSAEFFLAAKVKGNKEVKK